MGLDLVPQAPNHAAPTEPIGCFGNVAITWRSGWSLSNFGPNRLQLVLNSSLPIPLYLGRSVWPHHIALQRQDRI